MKIVKYIFLLLLLATIAITVFIATQEGKYDIKAEKVISVPKNILYGYVNDYKNWENLGLLTNADSTAQYTYSDTTAGNGATMSWNKNGTKGTIQTLSATASDSIREKVTIDALDSQIVWRFKDTLNSTKVAVRIQGSLTFTEKAYALINGNTNNKLKSSLANGLENLNTFLVKELKIYTVEVKGTVSKKGTFYLGQSGTSPMADITKKAGPAFDRLLAFAKDNNITVTGSPFIIYKAINQEQKTASYTISIPIKDEIFTAAGSEYEGGKLLAFNALKTTLKGDYSHLSKAWEAANKYVAEKALQENTTGQYVEVYSKNITESRRPSAWVTDLYIPIGIPQIVPEQPEVLNPPTVAARPAGAAQATRPATTTGAVKPVTPAGTKPAAGIKPTGAATTAKPATNGAGKPAGTGTSATVKPAPNKPATPKPAAAKPATSTTTPPATTPPSGQ